MIHDEKHYEVLAALAVAGQLSETEFLEFEQHAIHCSSCTHRIAELEAASRQLFMVSAFKRKVPSTPAGMQKRFLKRAINAGVPLSLKPAVFTYPQAFRLASVVALVVILSVVWKTASEKAATATKIIVSPPAAAGSAPTLRATSTVNRNEELAKKCSRQERNTQRQTPLLTSISPERNRAYKTPLFTLNSAFYPGNGRVAAGNFIVDTALSPTSFVPRTSVPGLWSMGNQKASSQRVFHYSATVAFLSFLDYQSGFKSKTFVPDLSIYSAVNPTQSR